MLGFRRKEILILLVGSFANYILLSESVDDSSAEASTSLLTHKVSQPTAFKLTPHELNFQIKLHGFLLWASLGFLMPVGVLITRMSQRVECVKKIKILYYSHVILQMVAVLLAATGAVLSIKNFENSFSNTHQKMGLALYALLLVQPLLGFCRPHRGVRVRSLWYFLHWLLGTGICVAGIINVYIGLHAYHAKTSTSVKLWTGLFTIEVAAIAFIYLFQDRCDYMKKQGVILSEEQITPTDINATPPKTSSRKELGVMFQMVEL